MVDDKKIIEVTNRDNGTVGYSIPDMGNLRRYFRPNETKKITAEEIKKLSWTDGGLYLIQNCLLVHDKELLEELFPSIEPEYYYTEDDIKKILLNGSLEQLLDCLDFARSGVIEILKEQAVKLKINDLHKRQAILQKTGFNVSQAIEIDEASEEENAKKEKTEKVRRSAPINQEQPVRRVITKTEE